MNNRKKNQTRIYKAWLPRLGYRVIPMVIHSLNCLTYFRVEVSWEITSYQRPDEANVCLQDFRKFNYLSIVLHPNIVIE